MLAPILQVLAGCDACPPDAPTEGRLFVRVDNRLLCARHWHEAGRPWPRSGGSLEQVHEAELRTRERMQARGGADAYRVKAGKS